MNGRFICEFCKKLFTLNNNLRRHIQRFHNGPSSSFKCTTCKRHFSDREEWHRHTHTETEGNNNDENINIFCDDCEKMILRKKWSYHKRTNEHKYNCSKRSDKDDDDDVDNLKCMKSSFSNRIATYLIENENENELIPDSFLASIREKVIRLLCNHIQKHENIKFNIELFAEYILIKEDDDVGVGNSSMIDIKSHQTKMIILGMYSTRDHILNIYNEQCDVIVKKMSEFQERDSGWTLIRIMHLEVNINQYKCIKGSNYIPLPPSILKKLACINIQNNDEYCFKWALISALNSVVLNSNRCTSYKINNIEDEVLVLENGIVLNFKNLNFPLKINEIKIFEVNNSDISINVFGLDEDNRVIGPYYFTQKEKSNHINLLLLEDVEKSHYIWIKNISR